MKRHVLVLFLLLSFSAYSQTTINNYKYAVVPEKYSFLKQNDQYSLNSLTKALLQDKGFTVYFDNTELPAQVANNRCRALSADLEAKSTMFTTGLTLVLKDCQGNIVFKSKVGKSREKEYDVAYSEALRDAFTSLKKVTYLEAGSRLQQVPPAATTTAAAASVKQPADTTPVKLAEAVPAAPVKPKEAGAIPVNLTGSGPVTAAKPTAPHTHQRAVTLYAQPIPNGYELTDTTTKIVLTLLKTSSVDYFIANSATANGIVLKKGEEWFFEYYKDEKLVSERLAVKF